MQFGLKFIAILLMSSSILVGCGGDSPVKKDEDSSTDGGTDGGTGGGGGGGTGGSGISYLPLNIYEAFQDFSGFDGDGLIRIQYEAPLIQKFLINPVDAGTLQSVTTAVASDYKVTIDNIGIDPVESFPILQKVIGNQVQLRTALLFDISGSVAAVNMNSLATAAKAYIDAARASSNSVIASQQFVVWVFADDIVPLVASFTGNDTAIKTAIDQVVTLNAVSAHGSSSNLHRAIVETIGSFKDDDYDFRYEPDDGDTDDNDLIDYTSADGIWLGHLVVFSSGPDTLLEFDLDAMNNAVASQSFMKYDANSTTSDSMIYMKKAVFYYVVGGATAGAPYLNLSILAERTTGITSATGYGFGSGLVQNQITAIGSRLDLQNQYVFRYAFLPRLEDHTAVFSSNATGHNYSLTTDLDEDDINGAGSLVPLVEVTGPNGEYISKGAISLVGTISLSEASTFRAAARWTTEVPDVSDISWTASNLTGSVNSDGSYTVTAITGSPATLQATIALDTGAESDVIELNN